MKKEKRDVIVQKNVFIADDGKEFEREYECREYEVSKNLHTIARRVEESKDIEYCSELGDYTAPFDGEEYMECHQYRWFKPLNEDGIKLLNEYCNMYSYSEDGDEKFSKEDIGKWSCIEIATDDCWVVDLERCVSYVNTVLDVLGDPRKIQEVAK